jgi:hypothetical protein
MRRGFLNQKLGKRTSRRGALQREKAKLKNLPPAIKPLNRARRDKPPQRPQG